jgi:hypothetical protein
MSDLAGFVALGFHHITDVAAMDHLLFLVALAATYQGRRWREALWVISAFTVGHSITLALAATHVVRLPDALIEFLIPLTIVATGLHNLRYRPGATGPGWRSALAGGFGLVHGAGFANYLERLFDGSVVLPLFGFNLGIELGQMVVLGLIAIVLAAMDRLMPVRLRTVGVSTAAAVAAAGMAVQRIPW